jgi:lysozyme
MDKLTNLLVLHEGLKLKPYRCTAGKLTIGIGHNLDAKGITPDQAYAIFRDDMTDVARELERRIPWIVQLDEVRAAVLADMAFNLGVDGLLKFPATLALVQSGKYIEASLEMLDSAWAKQVGKRATRLSEMMATGKWPKEIA